MRRAVREGEGGAEVGEQQQQFAAVGARDARVEVKVGAVERVLQHREARLQQAVERRPLQLLHEEALERPQQEDRRVERHKQQRDAQREHIRVALAVTARSHRLLPHPPQPAAAQRRRQTPQQRVLDARGAARRRRVLLPRRSRTRSRRLVRDGRRARRHLLAGRRLRRDCEAGHMEAERRRRTQAAAANARGAEKRTRASGRRRARRRRRRAGVLEDGDGAERAASAARADRRDSERERRAHDAGDSL